MQHGDSHLGEVLNSSASAMMTKSVSSMSSNEVEFTIACTDTDH